MASMEFMPTACNEAKGRRVCPRTLRNDTRLVDYQLYKVVNGGWRVRVVTCGSRALRTICIYSYGQSEVFLAGHFSWHLTPTNGLSKLKRRIGVLGSESF